MITDIISKTEYEKILKNQEELRFQMEVLREFVIETTKEELSIPVIKRLEKRSLFLDQGKGKHFNTISSFKSYLHRL
ncbi:hypothetical protein KKA09_04035 [Patescibacteria group bacterium]|nr:hypothetical protein [Patescibacteria group bacterium]